MLNIEKLLKLSKFSCALFIGIIYPILMLLALIRKIHYIISKRDEVLKSINGEIAVVTGGAAGLGKATAEQLAQHGCHIAILDIDLEQSKNTAKLITEKYQVKATAYKVDVTDFEQVVAVNENITKDLGVPTILINNAGIMVFSNLAKPDEKEIQRMINVNLTSHFWMRNVFLPAMKKMKKGHIVAISSVAGLLPLPYNSEYTSTKFAVRGLMRTLRQELIIEGLEEIKATTVFPYFLKTNLDVVSIVNELNVNQFHPSIDANTAALQIVNGIRRNEKEVVLPEMFNPLYRVIETIPADIQDFVINQLGKTYYQNFPNMKINKK